MPLLQTVANGVNTLVRPLVLSPRWNGPVRRWMTVVTYTGRRSGRSFTLPVGYARRGPDGVLVTVAMPRRKNWWRNFTGDGAPITVLLDGVERAGHGVVVRDGEKVAVDVTLSPA